MSRLHFPHVLVINAYVQLYEDAHYPGREETIAIHELTFSCARLFAANLATPQLSR